MFLIGPIILGFVSKSAFITQSNYLLNFTSDAREIYYLKYHFNDIYVLIFGRKNTAIIGYVNAYFLTKI